MRPELLGMLQCPLSGQPLRLHDRTLVSADGAHSYRLSPSGVPQFGEGWLSPEGAVQRAHYERIAGAYLNNLAYPHTREYIAYMDRAVLSLTAGETMDAVAEICCGAGEAFRLLNGSVTLGIGVDVSPAMLEAARRDIPGEERLFVNGDAMRLPLKDAQFDMVVMLGGIHHVNDRDRLLAEVCRILKPRGVFVWREPLDDFFLWRMLRAVVYKLSPTLESHTERPLRRRDTQSALERAGFTLEVWRTMGFLGYCFLMNSDVLAFNRVWKYIPGAAALTSAAAKFDEWTLQLPAFSGSGLAVVGRARRVD